MFSALPAVAPAYHLYGDAATDPVQCETRRLVSVLEEIPDHPAAAEIRAALARRGVIVPVRRGQLALALAGSTTHYDALILAQQDDIVAWTPDGFGPPSKRTQKPKRTHVLKANDAREKLAAFAGVSDAYLCPNEFKGWRQRKLLTAMNALYVDIDFHEEGPPPGLDLMKAVAEERQNHLERVGFPGGSSVTYSGRGIHLYWSHGRLPESEFARWTEVQKWLQATLDSDPRATDATRYLRLIGSVHSKTGATVTAERIGPNYDFETLYQRYLAATGRSSVAAAEDETEDEIAGEQEMAEPGLAATGVPLARVFDINVFNARSGRRTTLQSGIYRWFDRVYRDLRLIIEYRGWKGQVPKGHRNTLLYHLAVALSWFTEADVLRDEIMRANLTLIGLSPEDARSNTLSIVRAAHLTQQAQHELRSGTVSSAILKRAEEVQGLQARRARLGEFRYNSSRRQLWKELGTGPHPIIPRELLPQLRAIIPDELWRERQIERQRARDRVAEGRYQFRGNDLRDLQQQRRQLAQLLRSGGYGWDQVGAVLGISAGAARMLGRAS